MPRSSQWHNSPMALEEYQKKRDFKKTPEPAGVVKSTKGPARFFCVQKHLASHLHYDFRLEHNGVLLSWAVPKGPSLDPAVKRLAVPVPDHSLAYGDHEGPTVIIWDRGEFEPERVEDGQLTFVLHGEKVRGGFALQRWKPEHWLLIKKADDEARRGSDITAERPGSVIDGRTL